MIRPKRTEPLGDRNIHKGVDRTPADSAHRPVQLADLPLGDLIRELRRRGHDAIPAGCYAAALEELERFHAAAIAAAERQQRLVDATELVNQLAEYASVHYPAAVAEIGELLRKNADLEIAVDRAEKDASRLARELVGGEIDELQRGGES